MFIITRFCFIALCLRIGTLLLGVALATDEPEPHPEYNQGKFEIS